jgi:hypothetical protein
MVLTGVSGRVTGAGNYVYAASVSGGSVLMLLAMALKENQV